MQLLLLIDENPAEGLSLSRMLSEQGVSDTLKHVESVGDAEEYLKNHPTDLIVLDIGSTDGQYVEAVRKIHLAAPRVPLVVLTSLDDRDLCARALKEGAQDCLLKSDLNPRLLLRAVQYAVERKKIELDLLEEMKRAQMTLDSIGDGVACAERTGKLTFLNPVAEEITGWTTKEAHGRRISEVFKFRDATSHHPIANPMEEAFSKDRTLHLPLNAVLVRRDGVEVPVEDCVSPIHNASGQPNGAVIVFRDVTVARAMILQIAHAAQHDFLTGLPNRMLLNDRVNQVISLARRHSKKVGVLFLDLDGFKYINDSLGHSAGDRLLQEISLHLLECVRGSDTVSRQGGDEYIILLSEMANDGDAAATARRVLLAIAEQHRIDGHEFYITASIGISIYPDDGLDAETLIKNADAAMYHAKESGRQNFQFFKPAMNRRVVERQFIEESLRRAMERHELALDYQPKVNLKSGRITGSEALLRWTHPTRGRINPAEFIPVAEECGLILPIGKWVLHEACRQAKTWMDAGLPFSTMAVNISAVEFRNKFFLEDVKSILSETGLDPSVLELELTETALMKDPDVTESTLRALRKMGVQVAVDDFGTGYSSLSYLGKFSIDALKIDQSFVHQIDFSRPDATIVAAIIAIGRSLNLRVIAEGVERQEEVTFLQSHNCEEAQGYYFSRPVPPERLASLLEVGIAHAIIPFSPAVNGIHWPDFQL